jgi:uncharacterized protein YndB with AHSA1/START domain
VYRALLDPQAVARWKFPEGMKCEIHRFEPWEGGRLRVSLTYETSTAVGKSAAHTDTYHGRFVKLLPDEQVVEIDEFETTNPNLQGEMTITITLAEAEEGTELVATHEGLPRGVSPEDNETGWRMALAKLKTLVESDEKAEALLERRA